MRRLSYATVTAALAVATLGTGCTSPGAPPGAAGTTGPATAAPAGMPTTTDAPGRGAAGGHTGRASTDPTTRPRPARTAARRQVVPPGCASNGVPVDGLLRAIRSGHHDSFDRVVFEFCGTRTPAHRLAYVDQVRSDSSDQALPLHGQAFVRIVLPGATISTAPIAPDPASAPRYRGPTRLTPHHPLVAEVAIGGDFERMLGVGIGLRRPSGLHVTTLSAPPRLVVDFWAQPPRTLVWPATTLAEAERLQVAASEGHQPWWLPGTPESMATAYAQRVLGWKHPDLRRITPTVYQVGRPGTDDHAVLTLTQPVCPGNPGGLWNIADVAR